MKVLIIGYGSIAKKHVNALHQLDIADLELYALRNSLNSTSIKGVKSIFYWSEIDFKPDFILISNPTVSHLETLREAVKINVPLFIEKPVLHLLKGSEELLDIINKKSIPTYVACNLRFHECIVKLKQLLDTKELGRVQEVNAYCGSYLPDWRPGVDFKTIYSSNKDMGGGVHLDLIHELDYLYWLFGKPKNINSFHSSKSSLQINAIDYANYLLEYPDFSASIILNYFRKDAKRIVEVVCEKGTFMVDLISNEVKKNNKIVFELEENGFQSTYKTQMNYFVKNVLTTKSKSMNDFRESLEVLKICLHGQA